MPYTLCPIQLLLTSSNPVKSTRRFGRIANTPVPQRHLKRMSEMPHAHIFNPRDPPIYTIRVMDLNQIQMTQSTHAICITYIEIGEPQIRIPTT